MRLTFTFQIKGETLIVPLSYHHQLQALIYKMIGNNLSENLHDKGNIKPFVFSQLNGEYILDKERKVILFSNHISFSMASLDDTLLFSILTNTSFHKKYEILRQEIILSDVILEKEAVLNDGLSIINMLSPLTIHKTISEGEKKKTIYFNVNEEEFNEAVNMNFLHKIDIMNPSLSKKKISLIPYHNIKKANILYKDFTIIGYMGQFVLKAEKEQKRFLLNTGLGDRNWE